MTLEVPGIAIEVYDALLVGESFSIPSVNLNDGDYKVPVLSGDLKNLPDKITIDQFTTKQVDGSGYFDILMMSLKIHLKEEYQAGRISGREYAETYAAQVNSALSTATQLLLQRDGAFYQAALVQAQAQLAAVEVVTARVKLEQARLEYHTLLVQNQTVKADFALKKAQLALLEADYDNKLVEKQNLESDIARKSYELTNLVPKQVALITEQVETQTAQTANVEADTLVKGAQQANVEAETTIKTYTRSDILPEQKALTIAQTSHTNAQKLNVDASTDERVFNVDFILPEQEKLVKYQWEAQRAQTHDNHESELDINGLIGKQKELYDKQIWSYARDAEVKASKLFTDAWITTKTIIETTDPPTNFNNTNLNEVLTKIRNTHDLNP